MSRDSASRTRRFATGLLLALAAWTVLSQWGAAQIVRLPHTDGPRAESGLFRGEPGRDSNPAVVIELIPVAERAAVAMADPLDEPIGVESAPADRAESPPGAREGIFQRLSMTGTWLPGLGGVSDLGVSELELDLLFGFPFPTRESPLLIKPAFAVHYLEGPAAPDLPARVYDASVQFRWLRRLGHRWAVDLAVEPGVHSDFEADDSQALRILGRGLAIYDLRPGTQLVLGAAHLARTDVRVLPVGGIILSGSERWRWDLVFPQPRVSRRIFCLPGRRAVENWAYLGGEFGGGVWSIALDKQTHETVTVRDYRLLLGLQQKVAGGLNRHVEIGYVFGRRIDLTGAARRFRPEDTLMLRCGASY